ncbi:hypothetical protein ACJZ2D_007152 [Fusarium nematophilum]
MRTFSTTTPQLSDPPAPDQPFFADGGHLQFAGESILLTIEPDTGVPEAPSTKPLLRRYRILHDGQWVGAIFLGPEVAGGGYPNTTERCEFVKLTSFGCHVMALCSDILGGSNMVGLEPPRIFPSTHYEAARNTQSLQWSAWNQGNHYRSYGFNMGLHQSGMDGEDEHYSMPSGLKVYINHVM